MSQALRAICSASVFALTHLTHAQCPAGITIIDSQAEVDAFGVSYPDCEVLTGGLIIYTTDITDLSPFAGITRIEGGLQFTDPTVTDLNGFNNLSVVTGDVWISVCAALTSVSGFATLDTVGSALIFWQNNAMVTLDAFPDLDVCGVSLFISENPALTSVGGFGVLDSVGALSTSFNPLLTDLGAFDRPIAITNLLEVVQNGSLSICNVQAYCDHVQEAGVSGSFIQGNAAGCGSWDEVYASCISTVVPSASAQVIVVHPNPTNGVLYVGSPVRSGCLFSITDHFGRVVMEGSLSAAWLDVSALKPGAYGLRLMSDGRADHLRFVRE